MVLNSTFISQLPAIAYEIIAFAPNSRIFLFYGDMGAGKTTLIKSICECLGTTEPVISPTFSIVNEYIGANDKIYHFDFYRLKNQTEALDMGYEEYFLLRRLLLYRVARKDRRPTAGALCQRSDRGNRR